MKYFTSDLHLGDDRIGINNKPNLFFRPFKTIEEQNTIILNNLKHIKPEDELFIIGDIVYDSNLIELLKELPDCKKTLIIGNYDEDKLKELKPFFDNIQKELTIKIGEFFVFLNHYPTKCKTILKNFNNIDFAITGHIHSLWKVQPNIINVSTDAWHFQPVSEETILFLYNAMLNYYDENVFLKNS